MARSESIFGESAFELFAYLLAAPIFVGPGIILFQCIEWLKTGQWPPVPLSSALDFLGIPPPNTVWLGAQKVINFILDFPLSIVAFVLWMIVIIFVVAALEDARSRRQDHRQSGP